MPARAPAFGSLRAEPHVFGLFWLLQLKSSSWQRRCGGGIGGWMSHERCPSGLTQCVWYLRNTRYMARYSKHARPQRRCRTHLTPLGSVSIRLGNGT